MWIYILILCALIAPCLGEYCTERYVTYSGYESRTIHCSFGCCGTYYDQYCCVSNAGFIVGLIFAGIFVVSVITAVVCCCLKHKGTRGRVVQPSGTTSLTTGQHSSTATQNNVFIVPSAPIAPPAYSPQTHPPTYGSPYYPPPPGAPPYNYNGGYPAYIMPPAYNPGVPPPPVYSSHAVPPINATSEQPSPFAAAVNSGTNQQQHY